MFENKIRLTNIKDFRNSEAYDKQTLDEGEGTAIFQRYGDLSTTTIDNKFIFCSTSHFLSESLFWAISEDKECCVLIKDPAEFYKRITEANSEKIVFDYGGPCHYVQSRTFPFSIINALPPLDTMTTLSRTKPSTYSHQMENRGIWSPTQMDIASERFLDLEANVSDLLIHIEFSKLSKEDFYSGKTVTMTTRLKNGTSTKFSLKYPHAIHSPIIFSYEGVQVLAFMVPGNVLSGGHVDGGQIGLIMNKHGNFAGGNILDNIESIEFH